MNVIQRALRERGALPKSERSDFPAPEEVGESWQFQLMWIAGTVVQDQPVLAMMALLSVAYYAYRGLMTVLESVLRFLV